MNRRGLPLLLLLIGTYAACGQPNAVPVRTYQSKEPHDKAVRFTMAITPGQDVLALVPKRSGKFRLTRVRDWLAKTPVEQTIDIEGVPIPAHPKDDDPNRWLSSLDL